MIKIFGVIIGLVVAAQLTFVAPIKTAFAQTVKAAIKIPSIVKAEAGQDTALPIILESATGIPAQSMVLIRGMPSNVNLSDGRHFASGVWAVKPSSVSGLRIVAPPDIQEDTHLIISLVTLEGEYLSNVLSRLVITPAPHKTVTARIADDGQIRNRGSDNEVIAAVTVEPQETAKPQKEDSGKETASLTQPQTLAQPDKEERQHLTRKDIERILKLMQKGDQYLFEGKIAAARRFYQYASEMGWPDGAAAIARTYDPEHLKRFAILGGIQPNAKLATEWYAKARALGARIEVDSLRKIGQR